jgi:hypothetical protein
VAMGFNPEESAKLLKKRWFPISQAPMLGISQKTKKGNHPWKKIEQTWMQDKDYCWTVRSSFARIYA